MGVGSALAATEVDKAGKIANPEDITQLQNILAQVTNRAITLENIYCLLPFNQVRASLPAEMQSLRAVLRVIQEELLLQLPARPVNELERERIHERRETGKSS